MELMDGGELFDRIVHKEKYTEGEAREVTRILLQTLQYMHTHRRVTCYRAIHT